MLKESLARFFDALATCEEYYLSKDKVSRTILSKQQAKFGLNLPLSGIFNKKRSEILAKMSSKGISFAKHEDDLIGTMA